MGRPAFPHSLAEFQAGFADDEACRRYLMACRWPEGFRCPTCGDAGSYLLTTRDLLQCRACRRQTSVTAGTALDRTRLPLPLWFAAAYLVATHTPGFSALQLQRQLGLARYETAWTMLQKLRRAMVRPERDRRSGTVELDETYVGGVEEGRRGGRQRDSKKAIVAGAVEVRGQGSGRIRLAVVPDLSAATFARFAEEAIMPGTAILTDGWHAFRALGGSYEHRPTMIGDPKNAAKQLPRVHRAFANLKTWLLGTHRWRSRRSDPAGNGLASARPQARRRRQTPAPLCRRVRVPLQPTPHAHGRVPVPARPDLPAYPDHLPDVVCC